MNENPFKECFQIKTVSKVTVEALPNFESKVSHIKSNEEGGNLWQY